MSIPVPDQKALWGSAARRCAYRDALTNQPCQRELVGNSNSADPLVIVGEMAHIEGEKPGSARYRESMTDDERNSFENLILLCPEHHTIIDGQEHTYTIPRLKAMKYAHEDWVRKSLRPIELNATPPAEYISEELHSSLLAVEVVPHRIFSAPCAIATENALKDLVGGQFLPAFILRNRHLFSFWDLRTQPEYLRKQLDLKKLAIGDLANWEEDPIFSRYLSELLDRCLNKITGRRGLVLDKAHRRYFFPQESSGQPVEISYISVGGNRVTRSVVWNPKTKATQKPKSHWIHRAVALRFHRIGKGQWVVNVRPEFHFTRDGSRPLQSERIGPRSTKKKSRMWNYDLLQEIQFWRDYLGESQPRIILNMDGQSLVISCGLLRSKITWPGIPNDIKEFRTADIEDDLFSVADLQAVLREEQDEGFENLLISGEHEFEP
jgi:hypothetical protein